jgi:putative aldouronate transport system substrate-binding protein
MTLFRKFMIFICIAIIILPLYSCNTSQNISAKNSKLTAEVNLIYYTIGTPDKDLPIVNEQINKLLKEKCNISIQYNKIAWGNYGTRIATMISSGVYFDIAFATTATQGDFVGNAKKGAWLGLDPYLEHQGKEMYNAINPLYWDAMRFDGTIYGIPTNKEIAVPEQFMYSKELVDKYNIDISKFTTLDSLKPNLQLIHQTEPDYIGLELDNLARNYYKLDGYESLLDNRIPLMINSNDNKLKIINILETPLGYQRLKTIRDYYKAGFINKDAALKECAGLNKGEKVFCKISSGGPYSETIWSSERGYNIVAQQVSPTVVTNESARGGVMVVNSKARFPEQCVEFLNILNTDSEVRNLINFGIEGKHYNLTSNGQVNRISSNYAGVQYTQGNWFILNTIVGEPLNKWDTFKKFNKGAYTSKALGFNPELVLLTQDIAQIKKVCDKYYSAIMTGTVDLDKYLPRYLDELNQAGIQKVQKELQRQIDEWVK